MKILALKVHIAQEPREVQKPAGLSPNALEKHLQGLKKEREREIKYNIIFSA